MRKTILLSGLVAMMAVSAAAFNSSWIKETGKTLTNHREVTAEKLAEPSGKKLDSSGLRSFGCPTSTQMRSAANMSLPAGKKSAPADVDMPTLQGCVVYADSWIAGSVDPSTEPKPGIYSISADGLELVAKNMDMVSSYGQVYMGDKYFVAVPEIYYGYVVDVYYHIFDTATWTETAVLAGDYNFNARTMACDPVTGRVYALMCKDSSMTYSLATVDRDNYATSKVKEYGYGFDWSAMMFSPDGQLYAITKEGMLLKVDKLSGDYTEVGPTGVKSSMMTSATIDPASGRCFYVVSSSVASAMYEVDLTSGAAAKLFDMPENEQVISLFVPDAPKAEGAPAATENLTLSFTDNYLRGELKCTAPAKSATGASLTGTLDYTVSINGDTAFTGSADCGEDINADIEVTASGEYTIGIVFSNEAGEGVEAKKTLWIGNGRPSTPSRVKLEADGDNFILSWDAVTSSAFGGWFDSDNLTYTVTRYPDASVVYTGAYIPSLTEAIPAVSDLTCFTYGVTAALGDSKSSEGISNPKYAGVIHPAFKVTFDTADDMELITVVNANEDSRKWEYYNFGSNQCLKIEYSSSLDMDDYAVLWPARLVEGNMYAIGCDARATSYYSEKFEIVVAKGNDLNSLREGKVIFASGEFKGEEWKPYSAQYICEETGEYYVAIHGCSNKYEDKLFIDNISISDPVSVRVPAAPAEVAVLADSEGALSATVTFTLPSLNTGGNPLEEITSVIISRDGEVIATLGAAAPGSVGSYTDENPTTGIHEYSVTPVNSFGTGLSASASAFVGKNIPKAVTGIAISHASESGMALLSWQPVECDIYGRRYTAGEVTYNVLRSFANGYAETVASGLTECSLTDVVTPADSKQGFVVYAVQAESAAGTGEYTQSEMYPLGKPYSTPVRDIFRNASETLLWGTDAAEDSFCSWDIYTADELPFDSFDGNGVAMVYAFYEDPANYSTLYSGLFDLKGLVNPVLTFQLFDVACDNDINIFVNAGNGYELVKTVKMGEKNLEWRKVTVDLSAYKDKTVTFSLIGHCADFTIIPIDNFYVGNDYACNIAAYDLLLPESATPGVEAMIEVKYENMGAASQKAFDINLYCDGKLIETAQSNLADVLPGALGSTVFKHDFSVLTSPKPEISVKIELEGDECETDNSISSSSMRFVAPTLPRPSDLRATASEQSVVLEWTAPDLSQAIVTPFIDGVEDYTPFSIGLPGSAVEDDNIGDWTVYDVDGLQTYGTSNLSFPNNTCPKAFMAFNGGLAGDNLVFGSHSGNQMWLCLASKPQGNKYNDDWLVSPELAGLAQTVSFWAKSVATYGVDTFEVLYSTTGKEISDFTKIDTKQSTGDWARYEFELPEGALYFAIRCISEDRYAFLVDDITMVRKADVANDLELMGYHIYCDGDRLNDVAHLFADYTHADVEPGAEVTYHVTARLNRGESAPCEPVTVTIPVQSSVDTRATAISIKVADDAIVIEGAEGKRVVVADINGQVLHASIASASTIRVPVSAGVYMVKAGDRIAKVLVK